MLPELNDLSPDEIYLRLESRKTIEEDAGKAKLKDFTVSTSPDEATLIFERSLKVRNELRLSVVTPFIPQRRREFLNFLSSLSAQNFSRELWELVVVVDGQEPLGLEVEVALAQISQLRVYALARPPECKSFRLSKLRNFGASRARGKFLLFSDSDLWLGPQLLQAVDRALGDRDDWVQLLRQQTSKLLGRLDGQHWRQFASDNFRWNEERAPWRWASSYCFALRKESFFELGGFEESFSQYGFEDAELGYRSYSTGRAFSCLRLPVLHLERGPRVLLKKLSLRLWGLQASAQHFYRLHRDPVIYEELFSFMGSNRILRAFLVWTTNQFPKILWRPIFRLLGGEIEISPRKGLLRIWNYYRMHYQRNYRRLWQ